MFYNLFILSLLNYDTFISENLIKIDITIKYDFHWNDKKTNLIKFDITNK